MKLNLKTALVGLSMAATLGIGAAMAQDSVATLRAGTPLAENGHPPAIQQVINSDRRQVRNYPEQPPLIPHKTDGYQIDNNANQCLTCHSRTAIEVSQAPMISITHFMNRDNQFLASVTPRRYFCNQCHVTQLDAPELVANGFVDVDSVLEYLSRQEGN